MTQHINCPPNTENLTTDDDDLFFYLSQEMLCTVGFDGYFKKLNSAWEKTLGYTIEELLAKPYIEFVHSDDRKKTLLEAEKLHDGYNIEPFENQLVCKDGSNRWFLWSTVLVAEKQLFHGSALNITERKKTERDLQIRTEYFKCLINAAPYGIYMIDNQFTISHVNAYALPAFGNIPDLIGRNFAEVMRIIWPISKADEIIKLFRHTLETGEPCVVDELIEQRADRDATEYYAWQINRLPLPNGEQGVVCNFQDISQRTLTQQKIIESEDRYHTLFNCMDEGYCVVEMLFDAKHKAIDYRFLEVNGAFEEQSGLNSVTGKTILALMPDFDPGLIATYGQVALTGEPIRFEHESKELKRWLTIYAFRLKMPRKNKVAILFTNISGRKLAQLALTENQERLEAFITSSSDAIYSMSADWSEMNHLSGKDFVADSKGSNLNWLQDYIQPADQLAVQAKIAHAIQTKSPFEIEHHILRADKSLGWAFSRAVPLFNKQGDITEWFGTASDVTNRKLAQEALRQSEERFKILFELGPVAMYTVDATGRIQEFNRNAVIMWGREPKRGDPCERYCGAYKIYSPDGVLISHAENSVAAVLHELVPTAQDVEAILERLDGSKVHVIANVVPLKNGRNQIIGALSCSVDISDRKKLEDLLYTNNMELQEAKLSAETANLAK